MNGEFRPRARVLAAVQSNLGSESALLFGGFMLGNVVAYAYQMLMSRALSPADYGVLVTLTSVFYVLAVFWRAAQVWVIEAVAGERGASSGNPRAVLVVALRFLLPLGAIAFALHWVGSAWVADFLHLADPTPVVLLGLYVGSSFLMPVAVGLPIGLSRTGLASGILVLESSVRLVAGLALVILGLGVCGALAGFAIGDLVGFGVALVALWPLLARQRASEPAGDSYGFGGLDRYALLALVSNASLMIISSVDQVVVKHFFSDEVAGNYAVAFLLSRIISMSTIALGWVIFARSVALPLDDPRRRQLLVKGLLAAGAISLTLTAGYFVAPGLAVRLLGGAQYGLADGYVGLAGIEMALFSFVYVQAYYLISVRNSQVVWLLGIAAVLECALLAQYHATVQQILLVLIFVMGGLLVTVSGLSWRVLRVASPRAPALAQDQRQLTRGGV
jgi:O-antigen/teichoic acid export membrane protein